MRNSHYCSLGPLRVHYGLALAPSGIVKVGWSSRRSEGEAVIPRICRIGALLAVFCSLLSLPGLAAAQGAASSPPQVEVNQAVAHGVSGELKHMTTVNGKGGDPDKPLKRIPKGLQNSQTDPVIQSSPGVTVSASGGLSFAGVGQGDYGFSDMYAPPDTNMAVGNTQIIQWVNTDFAV